ncbi:MAG: hypothetical protein WB810_06845 [Candidatus Cybelea sp.]
MAVSNSIDELAVRSTFIFVGTVEMPGASALKVLPGRPQLAVVRFEKALRLNPVLGNLSGKPITVLLADGSAVRRGERFIFFAESWVHAEAIAVREFAHLADTEKTEQEVRTIVDDLPMIHLQERIASAALIVVGKVASVERASDIREPFTEHAPIWMRARIAAKTILKGAPSAERQELVVYFPSSHDRAWRGWPKLKEGESAIFLIHILEPPPLRLPPGAMVLPDPADVQPLSELPTIRKLLGTQQ